MHYKIFLDDVRNPVHCISYMHLRMGRKNPIYMDNGWVICRNYTSFVNTIESMGLPDFVSFDHDLAPEHYRNTIDWETYHAMADREKTGYDCAKWLVNYCLDHNLSLPEVAVHSDNAIGTERIIHYLNQAHKWTRKSSNT